MSGNFMPQLKRWLILVLFVSLWSCSSSVPRPVSSITITLNVSGCKPDAYRILAGSEMTLHFDNQTTNTWQWYFFVRPVKLPLALVDQSDIYINFKIPSRTQEIKTFTSPLAAGSYTILCSPVGLENEDAFSKLTVVQPNYP